jgi:hypothetical protein
VRYLPGALSPKRDRRRRHGEPGADSLNAYLSRLRDGIAGSQLLDALMTQARNYGVSVVRDRIATLQVRSFLGIFGARHQAMRPHGGRATSAYGVLRIAGPSIRRPLLALAQLRG